MYRGLIIYNFPYMKTMNPNNFKFCRKCERNLPKTLEYFTTRKTDKSGFNIYCKECINKDKREKRSLKRKEWDKGGSIEGGIGRRCTLCKTTYPESLDYFGKHLQNSIGLDTYCKFCRREKGRKNYDLNKHEWNKTHNVTREIKKQNIIEYKINSCGCIKCGEKKHYLLDFHHINPNDKLFQISQGESKGWDKIKAEIEKCILLCSNCHREFHYLEKKDGISIEEYVNLKHNN